jgi:hypothetical protein
MDLYFKIRRAREEIDRLNIEVRRVATYIRDETRYLRHAEKHTRSSDPRIAHQIQLYRMIRGRFTSHHKRRLRDIAGLSGFSDSILPGTSVDDRKGESASVWNLTELVAEGEDPSIRGDSTGIEEEQFNNTPVDQEQAEEDEEAEEAEDELIQNALSLLTISED